MGVEGLVSKHRDRPYQAALQELRSFPGAEHVISVEIEGQSDPASDINWTLQVTAKEGGNLERIQYAARTTSDRLKRRYSVGPAPLTCPTA